MHVVIENDINVEGEVIEIKLPTYGSYIGTFEGINKTYNVRGDRFHLFYYQIDSNPSIIDSIFCKPFDTTYLHLKF